MAHVTRAAIYVRASLDRTGEGAAVGRQEVDCRALAALRDWTVVATYSDNDTSATSRKPRPAYRRMLAEIKAGTIDAIVVWHVDRLARRLTDLEEVITLQVPIATVTGDMDLSNDTGRLMARILGSVAQAEVERKGARQVRANRDAAAAGRPGGGRRPFGYSVDRLSVVEEEAAPIREGYSYLLSGASLRSIAREWNAQGLTSTAGNPWRPDSVRSLLLSPRYAGLRTYRGELQATPGVWPAIVSEETWRAAVDLLTRPERRTTPDTARRYVLSGLARCGKEGCGAPLVTGRTQRGARSLRCSARPHLVRAAVPIEEYVRAVVLARLGAPDASDLLVDQERPDVDAFRVEAQALRVRLDGLASLVADGSLTPAQVASSAADLRARLATLDAEMTDAGRVDMLGPLVSAPDLEVAFDGLDVDRQRAIIGAMLHINVLPPGRGARTFDTDTVVLSWV